MALGVLISHSMKKFDIREKYPNTWLFISDSARKYLIAHLKFIWPLLYMECSVWHILFDVSSSAASFMFWIPDGPMTMIWRRKRISIGYCTCTIHSPSITSALTCPKPSVVQLGAPNLNSMQKSCSTTSTGGIFLVWELPVPSEPLHCTQADKTTCLWELSRGHLDGCP